MKEPIHLSGHWTDEQLINHLYGVGKDDGHLDSCLGCRERADSVRQAWASRPNNETVPADVLALQRIAIHKKIEAHGANRWSLQMRRWASVAALLTILGGGAAMMEQKMEQKQLQRVHQADLRAKVSDAELVSDVSQFADDSEPQAAAPIRGLFSE